MENYRPPVELYYIMGGELMRVYKILGRGRDGRMSTCLDMTLDVART